MDIETELGRRCRVRRHYNGDIVLDFGGDTNFHFNHRAAIGLAIEILKFVMGGRR